MKILQLILTFILFVPNYSFADDSRSLDIDVEADIHSSLKMQWQRIEQNDEKYQLAKSKLKLESPHILLPYGVIVELQTNDKNRTVYLDVDHLVAKNKIDKIGIEYIYVSLNGNKPISAKFKLPMLNPYDKGKLVSHTLLFTIKKEKHHKPGNYLAKFKFINNLLP